METFGQQEKNCIYTIAILVIFTLQKVLLHLEGMLKETIFELDRAISHCINQVNSGRAVAVD